MGVLEQQEEEEEEERESFWFRDSSPMSVLDEVFDNEP